MSKREKNRVVADLYAEAFGSLELVHARLQMLRAKTSGSIPEVIASCSLLPSAGNIDDTPTVECLTPKRRRSLPEEFREALADLLVL